MLDSYSYLLFQDCAEIQEQNLCYQVLWRCFSLPCDSHGIASDDLR
ncbi:hypothetical protein CLOSTMETH_00648 [[Clostridium] methylpentosum DSM 5476]|uniref:Uncharacterized protein n=1 Tax=[Clostridium] methylpentosum DSM 5476 TaxID=537013 RepID=C0E9Z4_9FIRM|nr:hypothetical protein CLOSTMETH_00648 [[Clostridium] methylpentosum DSM 5476]